MYLGDSVLLVDKPAGWTSFDVVAKIRGQRRQALMAQTSDKKSQPGQKFTKKQLRVGHAGTLDPFATGLLIVLLGETCRQAESFLKLDKTYQFEAILGQNSTTGDLEGEKTIVSDKQPSEKDILAVLEKFTGNIMQVPPIYSAIKIGGQRAYKLARSGQKVELQPRPARVARLTLTSYDYPFVRCECDVSSGTYIRSLVADIGTSLGTGAYCSKLRRTRIGKYQINDAKKIETK